MNPRSDSKLELGTTGTCSHGLKRNPSSSSVEVSRVRPHLRDRSASFACAVSSLASLAACCAAITSFCASSSARRARSQRTSADAAPGGVYPAQVTMISDLSCRSSRHALRRHDCSRLVPVEDRSS